MLVDSKCIRYGLSTVSTATDAMGPANYSIAPLRHSALQRCIRLLVARSACSSSWFIRRPRIESTAKPPPTLNSIFDKTITTPHPRNCIIPTLPRLSHSRTISSPYRSHDFPRSHPTNPPLDASPYRSLPFSAVPRYALNLSRARIRRPLPWTPGRSADRALTTVLTSPSTA